MTSLLVFPSLCRKTNLEYWCQKPIKLKFCYFVILLLLLFCNNIFDFLRIMCIVIKINKWTQNSEFLLVVVCSVSTKPSLNVTLLLLPFPVYIFFFFSKKYLLIFISTCTPNSVLIPDNGTH